MIFSSLLSAALLFLSLSAWADRDRGGDTSIGNGGGVWTCRAAGPEGSVLGSRDLVWIELVDLSEARRENNQILDRASTRTEQEWLDHVAAKIRAFNPQFYLEYLTQLERVQRLFSPTEESEFELIDDAAYRTRPSLETCTSASPGGTIQYEQMANFTDRGRLLINAPLWDSPLFHAMDRAALKVHEAIYALFRQAPRSHPNSVLARELVGYLFSENAPTDYAGLMAAAPRPTTNTATQTPTRALVPRPGIFRAPGDWDDLSLNYYNEATRMLYTSQIEREDGEYTAGQTFQCVRDGSQLICPMVSSTSRHLRGGEHRQHRVVIVDENTVVWIREFTGGRTRTTRYVRRR